MAIADKPNKGLASLWRRMGEWSIKRRLLCLALTILITVFSISIAPSIPFSTDPAEFMPQTDPDVKFWLDLTRRFGALDVLMVGLEEPDTPLTSDSLMTVARITDKLSELKAEGVLLARSLTNVETLQEDEFGTLNAMLLVSSIPRTPEARKWLSERILADTQVPGSLVSSDLMGYVLIIRTDSRKDGPTVARIVQKLVEAEKGDMKAFYFGAPFIANLISDHVYKQLPWLAPLFALWVLLVLLIRLRRPLVVFTVLLGSGLPLLWWFGLLRIFAIPLTTTSLNAILITLAAGLALNARAAERHLYTSKSPDSPLPFSHVDLRLLLGGALAFFVVSIFTTAYLSAFMLTTAVGFIAIALFAWIGYLPLLSWLHPSEEAAKLVKPFSRKTARYLRISAIVLLLISIPLTGHLRFFLQPSELFSESDEIGQGVEFFNRRFGGSDFLQISARGDFRNPAHAARLMRLTDQLEGSPQFVDIRSITQILGFLGKQFSGQHRIPNDPGALQNLWFFIDGNPDIRQLVSEDRKEAMIVARVPGKSDLTADEWTAAARKAVEDSKQMNAEATRQRLEALLHRYKLKFDTSEFEAALAKATALQRKDLPPDFVNTAHTKLHDFMNSPESPFVPSDEEWAQIQNKLTIDGQQAHDSLGKLIRSLPSFKELEYPDSLSDQLADTLLVRFADIQISLLCDKMVTELSNSIHTETIPGAFLSRAKGVFIDQVQPQANNGSEVAFTVSGYPAVAPIAEKQLLGSLFKGMLGIVFLWALFVWRRDRSWALNTRRLCEALLAAGLTLAFGVLFAIHVDSGSATLYFVAPTLAIILSPTSRAGALGTPIPNTRFAPTFSVALAIGCLTLLLVGIPPVMRGGAVIANGLITAALIAYLAAKTPSDSGDNVA